MTPEEQAGADAAAAAADAKAKAAGTPTPTTTAAETAPDLLKELAELRAFRATQEAQAARKAEEDRLAAQSKLVEKGAAAELARQHEEALQAERRKTTELAARNAATWKRAELASALSGQSLVPGAAEQLARLWDGELEARESGDRIEVRAKDGQAAAAWVAAQLKRPEYAHFVAAKGRPGGGAQGGQHAAPTILPDGSAPGPHVASTIHKGGRVITADHLRALAEATPAAAGMFSPGLGLPRKGVK